MGLDRAVVVSAALDLLDEFGLDHLTLRKIAEALGVRAPAIYWHFANKQELLDEMGSAMLRESMATQRLPDGDWPAMLAAVGHSLRRALMSRRDGGKLFGGSYLTDDSLIAAMEPVLARLVAAGFTLPAAVHATRAVSCFALGFVIEQQGTQGREAIFAPQARRSRIDVGRYPLSAAAGEYMFGDFDAIFQAGLAMIIAGQPTMQG